MPRINCPRSLTKGGLCPSVQAVSILTFCFSLRLVLGKLMHMGSSCYQALDTPISFPNPTGMIVTGKSMSQERLRDAGPWCSCAHGSFVPVHFLRQVRPEGSTSNTVSGCIPKSNSHYPGGHLHWSSWQGPPWGEQWGY